jgi:hypothetical protein
LVWRGLLELSTMSHGSTISRRRNGNTFEGRDDKER